MQNIGSKTVSVVVPCFNYAKYLGECIDSLVNQTYKLHEIIIVNDGSPDNTREVSNQLIEKYPEHNIQYLEKMNGGLSSARNYGINEATGDFIVCLDADDKLVPGAIEEQVKLMTDDMTIGQTALMEFGERHVVMIPSSDNSIQRILRANSIICTAMYPKKAWVEVGGYDESEVMRWGYEDWLFWIELIAKGYHVNTTDFIALRYRAHQGQMTQATSHPHRQELYKFIYNKHKALYDKYNVTIAGMI
jgi:glycosyltransferase involved in cell wall biosynthesis